LGWGWGEEGTDQGRGGVTEEGGGGDGADGGVGRGAVRVGRRKKVVGITRLTIHRGTYLKVIKNETVFYKNQEKLVHRVFPVH
jgi:hypothetical protein